MYHHHIADEDRVGHNGQRRQEAIELRCQKGDFKAVRVGAQRGAQLLLCGRGIEDGSGHIEKASVSLNFIAQSPLHPDRRADDQGRAVFSVKRVLPQLL